MSYFAGALARTETGWVGRELDLHELDHVDQLGDELRDLIGEGPGPALLLFEEDDEYLAVVRVDGGDSALLEPRVFLSDRRAVQASEVAAMLWDDLDLGEPPEDDEEESGRPVAEPVGDRDLLADLGTPGDQLVLLCSEEGLLPADVLTSLCERAGCADVLEDLRDG